MASARFGSLVEGAVSSSQSSSAFFVALLAAVLAYRIELAVDFLTSPVRPFDFSPGWDSVAWVLPHLSSDLALVVGCFLLSFVVSRTKWFLPGGASGLLRIAGLVFLHLLLFALLVIHRAHLRVLYNAQSGLDYSLVKEACSSLSFSTILKFVEWKDDLFLFLPIGLFWFVLLATRRIRLWMVGAAWMFIAAMGAACSFASGSAVRDVPQEIRLNPAVFLLSGISDQSGRLGTGDERPVSDLAEGRPWIRTTIPLYAHPKNPVRYLPPQRQHPWNVVFFIMESVGSRYPFDTQYGNAAPMPFLQKISREGWYFRSHYSTCNYSTKAIFSVLSGLYDFFHRETFALRPDSRVPSLYTFLPNAYERFLVTPSSLAWYFPSAFLKNSGLSEIYSYENLDFEIKETFHSLGHYIGRDEVQTTDFFIRRVREAKEPFAAVYLSFAAHFPYFDYGQQYAVLPDQDRLISRYYANLRLLDRMIERVVEDLKRQGRFERTIFVFVGDHGQAFGQHHRDNYLHYRYSYGENLEAPAILYQPAIFKPRVFDAMTSHVDLLPTLLDAMRISYEPLMFDGESLFQNRLRRKYLFSYGLEETISCIDAQKIKTVLSLRRGECAVFDLRNDPQETQRLDCSGHGFQPNALLAFTRYHDAKLVAYNEWISRRRSGGAATPYRSGAASGDTPP